MGDYDRVSLEDINREALEGEKRLIEWVKEIPLDYSSDFLSNNIKESTRHT